MPNIRTATRSFTVYSDDPRKVRYVVRFLTECWLEHSAGRVEHLDYYDSMTGNRCCDITVCVWDMERLYEIWWTIKGQGRQDVEW